MTTFDTIAERTGADPDAGLTHSWSGACPVCGGRRMLSLIPFEDGTAHVWCVSGKCDAPDVIAGLRLSATATTPVPSAPDLMFEVRHGLSIAGGGARASSWAPQDILAALSGDYEPERTEILRRADDIALFYPGRVHWLMGESESGKSWVAMLAAAEALNAGHRALFVDFESDLQTVGRRLLALGVPLGMLAEGLTYIRPGEQPLPGTDAERAFNDVLGGRYRFATVDGVTDALTVYGLNPNEGTDVASFIRRVPRRIADETGAAVACVDHVTKSSEGRGRFAIGSQHKMAGLDGVAYTVAPVEPLAPGKRGTVVLRVAKDRPGWVRAHAGAWSKTDRTQEAARIVLDSTTPGETRFEVQTPETLDAATGEAKEWRPTGVMSAVVDYLSAAGETTQTRLEGAVSGRASTVREAIGFLITDGVVQVTNGPRGSKLLALASQNVTPSPIRDGVTPSQNRDGVADEVTKHKTAGQTVSTPTTRPRPPSGTGWDGVGRGENPTASVVPPSIGGRGTGSRTTNEGPISGAVLSSTPGPSLADVLD